MGWPPAVVTVAATVVATVLNTAIVAPVLSAVVIVGAGAIVVVTLQSLPPSAPTVVAFIGFVAPTPAAASAGFTPGSGGASGAGVGRDWAACLGASSPG